MDSMKEVSISSWNDNDDTMRFDRNIYQYKKSDIINTITVNNINIDFLPYDKIEYWNMEPQSETSSDTSTKKTEIIDFSEYSDTDDFFSSGVEINDLIHDEASQNVAEHEKNNERLEVFDSTSNVETPEKIESFINLLNIFNETYKLDADRLKCAVIDAYVIAKLRKKIYTRSDIEKEDREGYVHFMVGFHHILKNSWRKSKYGTSISYAKATSTLMGSDEYKNYNLKKSTLNSLIASYSNFKKTVKKI
jgi:hypothetical protein